MRWVSGILLVALASPAPAQVVEDASVLRRGMLRITLDPFRYFWTERFDPEGNRERWTADFESDSLGPLAVPTLLPVQASLRSLTGLSDFGLSLGESTVEANADIRGTPLRLDLGVSSRLTLGVSLPMVKPSVTTSLALDTMGANVGWNPVLAQSGIANGGSTYLDFFDQLAGATSQLEANMAAGMYGCPTSPLCDAARDLADRATAFHDQLRALVLGADQLGQSPIMPLAGSTAAMALDAAVTTFRAGFVSLGVGGFTQILLHPDSALGTEGFQALLTDGAFGIDGQPLESASAWRIGDVHVSAKFLAVDGSKYRMAFGAVIRLPTGTIDDPDHFLDLASGNRQVGFDLRLHQDLSLGDGIDVSTLVRYVRQGSSTLVRRVASHLEAFPSAATRLEVERTLGDILQVTIAPRFDLSPKVSVSVVGTYHRKGSDSYTFPGTAPDGAPAASVLELDTGEQAWRFGGGVRYRGSGRFETGIQYLSTFRGDGGLTPAYSFATVMFRLYYGLWGNSEPPPDT